MPSPRDAARSGSRIRSKFHVVHKGGEWLVEREGTDRHASSFERKDDAIEAGRRMAQREELGQLIVHLQDGSIEKEYTYGDDPRDVPG